MAAPTSAPVPVRPAPTALAPTALAPTATRPTATGPAAPTVTPSTTSSAGAGTTTGGTTGAGAVPELPRTGAPVAGLLRTAAGLLLAGVLLLLLARPAYPVEA